MSKKRDSSKTSNRKEDEQKIVAAYLKKADEQNKALKKLLNEIDKKTK